MTYLMSLKKDLISKSVFIVLISLLFSAAPMAFSDVSVIRPIEKERIHTVADSVLVNIDCSLKDVSQLFINGQEVSVTGQNLRYPLELVGYGEKKINILAIGRTGKIEQYVRTVKLYRTFPDIKDHWAKREIECLATLGFLDDYYGGINFYPENPVSRVDLAKVIALLKNLPIEKYSKNVAQDVLPGYWGQLYINAVVNNNLLNVDEKDNFYPQSLVTRTDVVTAFVRDFPMTYYAGKDNFLSDLPDKFWAKDSIYTAMMNGLLPDKWDLKKGFLPNYIISRAELAALVARLPQVKEKIKAFEQNEVNFAYAMYETEESKKTPATPKQLMLDISKSKISANNKEKLAITFNSRLFRQAKQIKKVEIDLSPLGKLTHTGMFDDGQWGDDFANDNLYTVEVVPEPNLVAGRKVLPIQIFDVSGNEYNESVEVEVTESPGNRIARENAPSVKPEKRIIQTNNVPVVIPIRNSRADIPAPFNRTIQTSGLQENVYIVAPGDTMMVVAFKMTGNPYTWKDIAKYNNIKIYETSQNSKLAFNANIEIGQKIAVPKELLKKK